ncbi:protein FAM167B isoform X2 [Rhinatrema bivittatum]|uniref:protein FAM167B isoform X2 n=1 Tax=Rhinatrema bivittatum TaxID=194408 RepID=UPI001129A512|nr:protein FAM167B isoform X2 [Rhinatrema bivittatum]
MSFSNLKFKELGEEETNYDDDNLDMVKALTAKLKLQTRRPSYLEWKDKVQSQPWSRKEKGAAICPLPEVVDRALAHKSSKNQDMQNRKRDMQVVDHKLAHQLMRLRSQIHQLKVEHVCHQHKEMLDDATFGLEDCQQDSDLLCNIPAKAAFSLSSPLKHIGLTRMNINSRRFSLC